MEVLLKKVLSVIMLKDNTIVVFVGDLSLIDTVTTEIVSVLPDIYNATIDIQHIDCSTKYLKGHKFCVSFYHDSCFRYVSPHEFLNTHYDWLQKQVKKLYGNQREICSFFSIDDAFQEVCLHYLDKILSKYDGQCNLRTFVANRLRRYFQYIVNKQLEIRRQEILVYLNTTEEGTKLK